MIFYYFLFIFNSLMFNISLILIIVSSTLFIIISLSLIFIYLNCLFMLLIFIVICLVCWFRYLRIGCYCVVTLIVCWIIVRFVMSSLRLVFCWYLIIVLFVVVIGQLSAITHFLFANLRFLSFFLLQPNLSLLTAHSSLPNWCLM